MNRTVALEFVPPNSELGAEQAAAEAAKVAGLSKEMGLAGRIGHIMIPGMIDEDPDRPIEMKPKMDPLDVWKAVSPLLPGTKGICTQVTAFMKEDALGKRCQDLLSAGMEGIIFVGVPRTMADGEGGGVPPVDALSIFRRAVPNRGAILIPTRAEEYGRFHFKCERGATFALTQLLYSDAIVGFLKDFAERSSHRPTVLLSFGFVPKAEERVGLIDWLIKDPGNARVAAEQAFVADLAGKPFEKKKAVLLDLYQRVIDGARELGFPLGVHLETPYGFSKPAFETFAEMLEYYSP